MEIHVLHRQGASVREIARRLGLSRNTVRRYLRSPESAPRYHRAVGRPSKLDPVRSYLEQRIDKALPHRLPATVLHREACALGYVGSERLLRSFVSTRYRGAPPAPPVRFETPPGKQMQVDWAVMQRGPNRISAFLATLGYSRLAYVEFVGDEREETLLACHERAFAAFGGVPHTVLYDNMKTVVIQRDAHGPGQHRFHPALWDLARHYGFRPRLCAPYRAQTKGKVERLVRYVRHSFWVPLLTRLQAAGLSLDVETANAEVRRWLAEVANTRVHRTTGEPPQDRWATERAVLQPLPPPRPITASVTAPCHWPHEPLQRSPKTYDALLGAAA